MVVLVRASTCLVKGIYKYVKYVLICLHMLLMLRFICKDLFQTVGHIKFKSCVFLNIDKRQTMDRLHDIEF